MVFVDEKHELEVSRNGRPVSVDLKLRSAMAVGVTKLFDESGEAVVILCQALPGDPYMDSFDIDINSGSFCEY